MASPIRGRVIARTQDTLLVRTRSGDINVEPAGDAQPGDLVERDGSGPPTVVRAFLRGDYPTPENETARMAGDRRQNIESRATVLTAVREFFKEREFLEVETPLLVASPGLEIHLDAVNAGDGQYLITSPEYQMKRLLAGGFQRIYTMCKCFRAGESGARHNVEFTMLEWYRSWADLDEIREDTEALVARAAEAVNGSPTVKVGDRDIDVTPPWSRMTVADAMFAFANVEIRGDEDAEVLAAAVAAAGIDVGEAVAWDDIFYTVFVDHVEPALEEMDRPMVLYDWPAKLAALARRKPGNPSVVERFEAYIGGLELANAFGELTDPVEQRARFFEEQMIRKERGKPEYPIDEKLILALEEGLPPSAGIALGIDRLVMLIVGADQIGNVLTFSSDEL